MSKSNN